MNVGQDSRTQMRVISGMVPPINRLPDELLASIFKKIIFPLGNAVDLGVGEEQYSPMHEVPIYRIMLVCRLWREVTVDCGILWSYVDLRFMSTKKVNMFLKRSSQSPLSFFLSADHPDTREFITSVAQNATRLRTLCFAATGWARTPSPRGILQRPPISTPQLERLYILLKNPKKYMDDTYAQWILRSVSVDQLKALAIHATPSLLLSLPPRSWPRLTHLFICVPPDSDAAVAKPILNLLLAAPMLQHINLSLSEWIPLEDSLPDVTLSHLRSLVLRGPSVDWAFLILEHLTLPPSLLLSIHDAYINDRHKGDVPGVSPMATLRFPLSSFPPQSLTFMELSIHYPSINWTATNAEMTSGFLFNAQQERTSMWSEWTTNPHMGPLYSHIQVLHLHLGATYEIRFLQNLLPYFVHVKELVLMSMFRKSGENAALELLHIAIESLTRVTPVICPELRFLGFSMDVQYGNFPFVQLMHMMQVRALIGVPLARFVYQPREKIFADEQTHRWFAESLALMPGAEYLHQDEASISPFKRRECWALPEANTYWHLSPVWEIDYVHTLSYPSGASYYFDDDEDDDDEGMSDYDEEEDEDMLEDEDLYNAFVVSG